MKIDKIQTKRNNIKQKGMRRLHAKVSRGRKQRASTSMTGENNINGEIPTVGVKRALMIILLLHIVAIPIIMIVTKGGSEPTAIKKNSAPLLNPDYQRVMVTTGSTYASIAKKYNVSEESLRKLNKNIPLYAGFAVNIPDEKLEITTPEQPSKPSSLVQGFVSDHPDIGENRAVLVEERPLKAIPVQEDNKAVLVKPTTQFSGKFYSVQTGDTIWRISNKFKVSQNDLLKINHLNDPRKLKIGMKLKIPSSR